MFSRALNARRSAVNTTVRATVPSDERNMFYKEGPSIPSAVTYRPAQRLPGIFRLALLDSRDYHPDRHSSPDLGGNKTTMGSTPFLVPSGSTSLIGILVTRRSEGGSQIFPTTGAACCRPIYSPGPRGLTSPRSTGSKNRLAGHNDDALLAKTGRDHTQLEVRKSSGI